MIYFIQIAIGGPIKIGVSNSPFKRLQELQTSHPCKLELIGIMDGEREQEQELHAKLKEFRINGEWFKPCKEIFRLIDLTKPLIKFPKKKSTSLRGYNFTAETALIAGAKGGTMKGKVNAVARDGLMSREEVQKMVDELGYVRAAKKLGAYFSVSTLRRQYRKTEK